MKTAKLCLALLSGAMIVVCSCKKDNTEIVVGEVVNEVDYDIYTKSTCPVYFCGSAAPEYLDQALRARLPYIVSNPDDAKAIIVNSLQMEANKELLKKAWAEDKIIVEMEPNNAAHTYFWANELGESSYLDISEQTNNLLFIARYQGSCFQFQDPFTTGSLTREDECVPDENVEPEPLTSNPVNVSYEPVAIGQTPEFINTKLSSFVDWINRSIDKVEPFETNIPSFIKEISGKIEDANYTQIITKPIPVKAEKFEICKVALSEADKVDRHSKLDLKINIMPFHSYETNKIHGDLYFVTAKLDAKNNEMFGLYTKYHNWVKTYSWVFFSKDFELYAEILGPDKKPLTGSNVAFFDTPVPASTQTSMEYNTGFSANVNLAGQVGRSCGHLQFNVTVGGSFTWSNSKTKKVSDLSIEMSTNSDTRAVNYHFITNNIQRKDEYQKAIPALGRTDETCETTWCWQVPGAKDDDLKTQYYMRFKVIPHYGWIWRHLRWDCGGEKSAVLLNQDKDGTFLIPLDIPRRTREGIFDLKSTFTKYLTNVKIYNSKDSLVAKSTATLSKDSLIRFQLPVGEYHATYEQRDGDDGHLEHKYKMEKITIATAETTLKSANEGKIVDAE